ncbi:1-carboxy-3-chloro-3,4-dihydroxycyclo hexa-1,5-diene dehydrogenase [Brevibacillus agri]|uniref:1-carboxy-3-chloro-3,4-dihydroxycyclo hexa-1,5-diene dehydrogenase n=1 Tax=Brevibacillus agri TaxID=51101 RepID=A0A3M8AKW1_9BACL|nr:MULTISPECIES: Gfo/Idh/MocA family oxidoreductase [Brevibacillus]EJL42808.1 putative dehydrogenase [Brevibacillus sp. CF112]MBY0052702.1 Gfo/Idh/MocA family oxidoreductase [Brevibacillus agri]MCG5253857.1 Gfo/Idh/MocA family oxidoreductase [Brevibacillus agri]MDN4093208.1 Gfo/Idh/MocA family oxidoreductase [Brevibacillus agri]MED1644157.1 Gfo/Idh/MocA family oxidoreductase [Brevibacillus agri]
MNESKRKVGVIGAGVMGERMMNALRTHEKFSVAAVSDVSAERAQEAAQKSGNVPWYTDYKELLAKEELDAVYLAVPPKFHHAIALDVLAHKKHLLCEKPLANSLAEAEDMLAAAKDAGVVHAMNFPLYYQGIFPALRSRLEEIGEIRRIDILTHFHTWPRPWQQTPWLSGREQGGFIREVLPHFTHLTYALFGDLQVIRSDVDYPQDPEACETGVSAFLRLACGTPVTINGLAGIAHQEHLDYRIYGTKGTLSVVNWSKLFVGGEGEAPVAADVPELDRLSLLLDELALAIDGQEARLVTFETGVKVQKVLEGLLGHA